MSKTIMALIAIFAMSAIMGTGITLVEAAKPDTTTVFETTLFTDNNWCSVEGEVDTHVVKHILVTSTIFGGDNYKTESTITYELFNSSNELIGEGLDKDKTQGKFNGDVVVYKEKVRINCLNGEEDVRKTQDGYTLNRNGEVSHGN
jgi:hypothetical protein